MSIHDELGDDDYLLNLVSRLRHSRWSCVAEVPHVRVSIEEMNQMADRLQIVRKRRQIITHIVVPILVSLLVSTGASLVIGVLVSLLLGAYRSA